MGNFTRHHARSTWRETFTQHIAPRLSRRTLVALAEALERQDSRLARGINFAEGPGDRWLRACPLCYALAIEHDCKTASALRAAVIRFMDGSEQMGQPVAPFLLWVDGETDAAVVWRELAVEVRRLIEEDVTRAS